MGRKKIYKEDKTEDFDAEALEPNDPTLDDNGEPIADTFAEPSKEDGSISSTDGVSEEKPADEASHAIEPADEAPKADVEASDKPAIDEVALPGITDTGDNAVKDQDGQVMDDTGSAKPAADAGEKGPTDGVVDPTMMQEAAEGGEPSKEDGPKEGGEAEAPKEDEAPKAPSEMPGMSPVNGVGEVEAQLGVAPASTNVDSVSAGDTPPALSEVLEAAKPVVDTLDGGLVDSFKEAGNKATEAIHGLKSFEAEIAKLPAEAKAIVNQLRHMGAHFVAACERIFKRD